MDAGAVALQEAVRRRAGMGASSAGMGAPAANSPMPSNPLAQQGMTPQPSVPQAGGSHPPTPTAENPMAGAMGMMDKAQPNSETMLIKYLGDHLKKYAPVKPLQMP